jgi:hypothetical protein
METFDMWRARTRIRSRSIQIQEPDPDADLVKNQPDPMKQRLIKAVYLVYYHVAATT